MGMPPFPMQGMFPMQPQATPPNLINQPFIHLSDYTDDTAIRAAFPASHIYNDPNFDVEAIKSAEFFILRSSCDDDIHKVKFLTCQKAHSRVPMGKFVGPKKYFDWLIIIARRLSNMEFGLLVLETTRLCTMGS
jgi:hypothetical protein